MEIKKVVVAGGGVLGSQIAYQCAYCGYDVTIWLRSESSITRTQPKLDNLRKVYADTISFMATKEGKSYENWARGIADYDHFDKAECLEKSENAYSSIKLELDLSKGNRVNVGRYGSKKSVLSKISTADGRKNDTFNKFFYVASVEAR